MARAKMGAVVKYCGHDGTFVADIYECAGANVVHAGGPINGDTIDRSSRRATHYLTDFPVASFWHPRTGMFVVPADQVKELPKDGE